MCSCSAVDILFVSTLLNFALLIPLFLADCVKSICCFCSCPTLPIYGIMGVMGGNGGECKSKTVILRQPPLFMIYRISVLIFILPLKFIKLPFIVLLKPLISVSLFVALSVILIPTTVELSFAVYS